jgi:hypothetical protein
MGMYEQNEQLYLKLVKTRWTVKETYELTRNPDLTYTSYKKGQKVASNEPRPISPGQVDLSQH